MTICSFPHDDDDDFSPLQDKPLVAVEKSHHHHHHENMKNAGLIWQKSLPIETASVSVCDVCSLDPGPRTPGMRTGVWVVV